MVTVVVISVVMIISSHKYVHGHKYGHGHGYNHGHGHIYISVVIAMVMGNTEIKTKTMESKLSGEQSL